MVVSRNHDKPTARDVAARAGVSLATVDRVLNRRPGVRSTTRQRVEEAVSELGYSRDLVASLLARGKTLKINFLIPDGANPFMQNLRQAVRRNAGDVAGDRVQIDITEVKALDPEALAGEIGRLNAKNCDTAIIVASDEESVRKAVARATRRGINIVTLVSDLPRSRRKSFIGIDNVAAGRTAASLMGRFCPSGARVGLIVGSMDLRDHRDRFIGFHDLILEEFPGLELVGPVEGFDDSYETGKRAQELLAEYPDIAGIYAMGAGISGLTSVLKVAGRTHRTKVVVHELTADSIQGLQSGVLDVVLDQNPRAEVEAAIAAARDLYLNPKAPAASKPVEIGIFLRDNLTQPDANGSSAKT